MKLGLLELGKISNSLNLTKVITKKEKEGISKQNQNNLLNENLLERTHDKEENLEEAVLSVSFRFRGMTMSTTVPAAKPARGRGPADGRAFFETLWRGNFLLDRQKMLKRSRKRKLHAAANGKRQQRAQQQQLLQMRQHCCCCQRIQLHLLAGRRSNMRSVVR